MGSVELACLDSGAGPDLDSEAGRVDPSVTRTSGCMLLHLFLLGSVFMFYHRVFTPAIADPFLCLHV